MLCVVKEDRKKSIVGPGSVKRNSQKENKTLCGVFSGVRHMSYFLNIYIYLKKKNFLKTLFKLSCIKETVCTRVYI